MTYALPRKADHHDPLSGRGRTSRGVTGRQLAVLTYLRRYIATHQCSPVIGEVCQFLGTISPQCGARYLQALLRKGMTRPLLAGSGYQLTPAGLAATEDQDLLPLPERHGLGRRTVCATR